MEGGEEEEASPAAIATQWIMAAPTRAEIAFAGHCAHLVYLWRDGSDVPIDLDALAALPPTAEKDLQSPKWGPVDPFGDAKSVFQCVQGVKLSIGPRGKISLFVPHVHAFVLEDPDNRRLIVSFRGTFSFEDVEVDSGISLSPWKFGLGFGEDLEGKEGRVHTGFLMKLIKAPEERGVSWRSFFGVGGNRRRESDGDGAAAAAAAAAASTSATTAKTAAKDQQQSKESAAETLISFIQGCLASYPSIDSLLITGHSLGGGEALLFAGMLRSALFRDALVNEESTNLRITVVTFGSPRVGDIHFVRSLMAENRVIEQEDEDEDENEDREEKLLTSRRVAILIRHHRVQNELDLITRAPYWFPTPGTYKHCGHHIWLRGGKAHFLRDSSFKEANIPLNLVGWASRWIKHGFSKVVVELLYADADKSSSGGGGGGSSANSSGSDSSDTRVNADIRYHKMGGGVGYVDSIRRAEWNCV